MVANRNKEFLKNLNSHLKKNEPQKLNDEIRNNIDALSTKNSAKIVDVLYDQVAKEKDDRKVRSYLETITLIQNHLPDIRQKEIDAIKNKNNDKKDLRDHELERLEKIYKTEKGGFDYLSDVKRMKVGKLSEKEQKLYEQNKYMSERAEREMNDFRQNMKDDEKSDAQAQTEKLSQIENNCQKLESRFKDKDNYLKELDIKAHEEHHGFGNRYLGKIRNLFMKEEDIKQEMQILANIRELPPVQKSEKSMGFLEIIKTGFINWLTNMQIIKPEQDKIKADVRASTTKPPGGPAIDEPATPQSGLSGLAIAATNLNQQFNTAQTNGVGQTDNKNTTMTTHAVNQANANTTITQKADLTAAKAEANQSSTTPRGQRTQRSRDAEEVVNSTPKKLTSP